MMECRGLWRGVEGKHRVIAVITEKHRSTPRFESARIPTQAKRSLEKQ